MIDPKRQALLVDMHNQLKAELLGHAVAESDHVSEFPRRVDMQYLKGEPAGIECLTGDVKQHIGVLSDGIKQHRGAEFRDHLMHDGDRFRFESSKMQGKASGHAEII